MHIVELCQMSRYKQPHNLCCRCLCQVKMDTKKDSITELLQFNVGILYIALNSVKNLQCCESWEIFPLEFNWFSIDSILFSVLLWVLEPLWFGLPFNVWLREWSDFPKTQHSIWEFIKNCSPLEKLPLGFPIVQLLLLLYESFPSIMLYLCRHMLLLSPIVPLDRWVT